MKEKIPQNTAQVVEAVAAHGNDVSRSRVQGMVARDRWAMEFPSPEPTVGKSSVVINVVPIRTENGGIRFMHYSRVPF